MHHVMYAPFPLRIPLCRPHHFQITSLNRLYQCGIYRVRELHKPELNFRRLLVHAAWVRGLIGGGRKRLRRLIRSAKRRGDAAVWHRPCNP